MGIRIWGLWLRIGDWGFRFEIGIGRRVNWLLWWLRIYIVHEDWFLWWLGLRSWIWYRGKIDLILRCTEKWYIGFVVTSNKLDYMSNHKQWHHYPKDLLWPNMKFSVDVCLTHLLNPCFVITHFVLTVWVECFLLLLLPIIPFLLLLQTLYPSLFVLPV